MLKVNIKYSKR